MPLKDRRDSRPEVRLLQHDGHTLFSLFYNRVLILQAGNHLISYTRLRIRSKKSSLVNVKC